MANRIQIPISFSYQTTVYVSTTGGSTFTGASQVIVVPAATATCTVTNRATMSPATVYAALTGGSTISPVITDTSGNVPGYLPEGSYTIAAAAAGGFGGASVNWEAAYGAGVANVASNAVDTPQLSTTLQTNLSYYQPALPVGTLTQYTGATDPTDADGTKRWMLCDGRSLSTSTYATLHSVVGYAFGGSGANFNLPNGANAVMMGLGTNAMGATGGASTVTLTATQMPVHAHSVSDPGHAHSISDPTHAHSVYDPSHLHTIGTSNQSAVNAYTGGAAWTAPGVGFNDTAAAYTGIGIYGAATGIGIYAATTGLTTVNAGSGGSHNNLQPYVAVNHLIKVL